MGLLAHHRRFWIAIVLVLLALPMVGHAVMPRVDISKNEARRLTQLPALPRSLDDVRELPRALDRFLADRFGFRDTLVRAHSLLRFEVALQGTPEVVVGRERWLFLGGDALMEQVMGKWLRRPLLASTADRMAAFARRMNASGARVLVAVPPNTATIMRSYLPAWAAEKPPVTEYDLLLAGLAERGIATVDLRPPLIEASKSGPVYFRTDTHWNSLGALISYNAVAGALGRADWIVPPEAVLRGFKTVGGGDLARMLGVADSVTDLDARIDLSPLSPPTATTTPTDTGGERSGVLTENQTGGPTVVLIGDSFTQRFWPPYFNLHVGRVIWVHYEQCSSFERVAERYKPDFVVLAPTERAFFCKPLGP